MKSQSHRPDDKREKLRFPLKLDVRYRILKQGKSLEAGSGLTADISSAGIAFTAERMLPLGVAIEMVIAWPVALEDGCPLQLVARGRLVRREGSRVACAIQKIEIRTKARMVAVALALAANSPAAESARGAPYQVAEKEYLATDSAG
jgi:hypothetical protein